MKQPTRQKDGAPPRGPVDVRNRAALEAWLQTKPREVSVAIAARAALRVLPLTTWESESKITGQFILNVFRSTFVSYACSHPTDERSRLRLFAIVASMSAKDLDHSGYYYPASAAANAARHAAKAAAHFSPAAGAAVSSALSAAVFDSHNIADALTADIRAIDDGLSSTSLLSRRLWDAIPAEYADQWSALRARLLARKGEHWHVWTDWYEARLSGRPSNERLDIARATIANDIWAQGPAVVNAQIERLIRELEPMPEPAPEPGPIVALTEKGIAIVPRSMDGAFEDALQRRLQAGLRRLLPKLTEQTHKVSNEHRELHAVVSEYAELAEQPFDELDVVGLWMVGSGMIAFSEAFGQPQNSMMASPLEPECRSLLRQVAEIHGAFILGFPEGRLLADRAAQARLSREIAAQISPAAGALLQRLRKAAHLVEARTRQFFGAIDDAQIALSWEAGSVGYAAFAATKNTLIAIGRVLIVANSALATVVGAPVLNDLDPGQVYTAAIVAFVVAELQNIMVFAAAVPELRVWFESIALTLDALKQYHLTKR